MKAYWIASLIVPGWAQLMAARWSAFVWLALALLAWCTLTTTILAHSWVDARESAECIVVLHALAGFHARRLFSRG